MSSSALIFTYTCDEDDFTATGPLKEVVQAHWNHEAEQHGAPLQTWEKLQQ
jgi:hypothetical protein